MPDSTPDHKDVEMMIREMLLEMGDEQLLARFDGAVAASDERHRRISKTLDELSAEVDELLRRMDAIEAAEESSEGDIPEDETDELC